MVVSRTGGSVEKLAIFRSGLVAYEHAATLRAIGIHSFVQSFRGGARGTIPRAKLIVTFSHCRIEGMTVEIPLKGVGVIKW